MVVIGIVAFIIGFLLGRSKRLKSMRIFTTNKITKMRNRINNKSWILAKYQALLQEDKENATFKRYECETGFVGASMAKHNSAIYKDRQSKISRRLNFIKDRIKIVDTNYYLKFIGTIPDDELKALKRDKKLTNILD